MPDANEVTNAPNPPGKDPLTPGKLTTEFLLTGVGMFLASLFAALAAFDVLSLSPEQKNSVYELGGAAMIVLPGLYAAARSYVKGKAVSPSHQTTEKK